METPKERLQREREKKEFLASLSLREDYRLTFGTDHGRRVLEDMITRGHMLETTCSGNAWSYFYEGERNWVLRIMSYIPELVGDVMAFMMARRQVELNRQVAEATRQDEDTEDL